MNHLTRISLSILFVTSLITGCGKQLSDLQGISSSSTPLSVSSVLAPAKGNFRLAATDAPFSYDFVSSAKVTISRIDVRSVSSGYTTIMSQPVTIDLVGLKNGMISTLSDLTISPGQYNEVQLFISAASVDLKNGSHFNLTVPSGPQSGLKIFINPAINVTTQVSSDVLLDFDLSRSFIAIGNTKSVNGITGFNFLPVIRASNLTTAGTVSGKVLSDNGTLDTSDDVPLAGAIASVSQNGTIVSTSVSDANGNYKIIGLPEGAYSLDISAEGYSIKDASTVTIVTGNVTSADITLLNFIVVAPTPTP